MTTKDQLIEETLNSLKGISRADASPFLYENVMLAMQKEHGRVNAVWTFRWQLAALSFLLILNTFLLLSTSRQDNKNVGSRAFSSEYVSPDNRYNY
jgi:hypothetical protein